MKVLELQNSFGIDSLKLTERNQPEPGPDQVLVKVKALSLNYRDLLMVKGLYNPKMSLPMVPFSDGTGEVVAIGNSVTRVKTGDRVAAIFMQSWIDGTINHEKTLSSLGGGGIGMGAEYVVLSEAGLVKLPDHLSWEQGATLPCAAVTAWNSVMVEGKIKSGDTVVILGTGGVSIFALQFAKIAGARVIITSSSDEKLSRAKQLGADELINYKKNPNWDKAVKDLTGGTGADLVVEVGGSGTFNKSMNSARIGGQVSMIGVLSGISGDVSTISILMKALTIKGIYVGSRQMFENMNKAIILNKLKPVIDKAFPFEKSADALHYMESGSHFGKIVVTI